MKWKFPVKYSVTLPVIKSTANVGDIHDPSYHSTVLHSRLRYVSFVTPLNLRSLSFIFLNDNDSVYRICVARGMFNIISSPFALLSNYSFCQRVILETTVFLLDFVGSERELHKVALI